MPCPKSIHVHTQSVSLLRKGAQLKPLMVSTPQHPDPALHLRTRGKHHHLLPAGRALVDKDGGGALLTKWMQHA